MCASQTDRSENQRQYARLWFAFNLNAKNVLFSQKNKRIRALFRYRYFDELYFLYISTGVEFSRQRVLISQRRLNLFVPATNALVFLTFYVSMENAYYNLSTLPDTFFLATRKSRPRFEYLV